MTITDKRTFDAIQNIRAYVDGSGEDVMQEMDDDLEELIAAVTDTIEKRLRRGYQKRIVGEVRVESYESEDELTAPKGSPDRIVTCNERFYCDHYVSTGTYYLVKKETT